MFWVAWKMLIGNRGKYLGIILGIGFASLLIAQQASIFWGLMRMTISQVLDIQGAQIWVMDRNVEFVDDIKPMSDNELYRVRGVSGVKWAVRLYKGLSRLRMTDERDSANAGKYQQVILLGLDDATLVGAPRELVAGTLADIRLPDAVVIDEAGYKLLWPGEPYQIGRSFEMNDRRAVIVGVCKARRTFQTFPIIYARYSQATQFVPGERKVLSFILAEPDDGVDPRALSQRIAEATGLQAMPREDFADMTMRYFLTNTGIPINFGITVLLGFIVGTAIAGQTFYLFTVENIKQYGALKAMGASNSRLALMVMLQALIVGLLGYSLGVGAAASFGELAKNASKLAFYMNWNILAGTGVAVVVITLLSSVLSIYRVLALDPAVVFQG